MKSKRTSACATDSLIRLRAANDRLESSLKKGPRSVPPPPVSAWSKADEILLNIELERRAYERAPR